MRIEQATWTEARGWAPERIGRLESAGMVLLFGSTRLLGDRERLRQIAAAYPCARMLGCSTAGEICGTQVLDDTLVLTAVELERTRLEVARVRMADVSSSAEAGERLAHALLQNELVHVLVFSEGLRVNGSELVTGLVRKLPRGVAVTGGLAGDGERFENTLVVTDDGAESGAIVAAGFYGKHLKVGYGSMGGWDPFGPERLITRSKGNVLYELDGHSALELYKRYLGEHASGLPATGLLFPLSLRTDGETRVVRTILGVNDADQSMTFAGDMPEGAYARLMKANFERLIDGAHGAAKASYQVIGSSPPELAVLISCVGRKLVLKQRVEEEVESVRDVLGGHTVLTGYYSYGELSPFTPSAKCELHNQTMTITTFSEM